MRSVIGGSRRRWTAALVAAGLAFVAALVAGLVLAEAAAAGTYKVRPSGGSSFQSKGSGAYAPYDGWLGVQVVRGAKANDFGRMWWVAPADTAIVGARGTAILSGCTGCRHFGSLWLRNFGSTNSDTGISSYGWYDFNRTFGAQKGFGVQLACGADSCPDDDSIAIVGGLELTLHDGRAPNPHFDIHMDANGFGAREWQRGRLVSGIRVDDRGGGVRTYAVEVNGRRVDGGFAPCSASGFSFTQMRPCRLNYSAWLRDAIQDTRNESVGWRNGLNTVVVRAWDAAGNGNWTYRHVKVDNEVPRPRFADSQDPSDPELIRAPVTERYSGVEWQKISYAREGTDEWHDLPTVHERGELRARVDSEAVPAGRYKIRARARDKAGNESGWVHTRENGQPMVLRFPLRAGTEIRAGIGDGARRRTVKYGKKAKVRGRLLSADRDPLPNQTVLVHERYDPGSFDSQRTTQTSTDERGRFDLRLPAGPSREVEVTYPGSRRYRPAGAEELDLNVKSKARFKTSRKRVRAGKRVTFKGKVKHRGTQIPSGGKLVELQVKEGARRWGTVRQAFSTREDGWYSLRYRFGNFYRRPVRFKFRVKVTRENGWPYKAPVRSRARRVTVVP